MPKVDETAKQWQKELAARAGNAVRERRKVLNLTAAGLAKRTAELGYPVSRVAIGKLENNHREGKFDLAELVVLAAALGIPPVMLIYPDLPHGQVEVLPEINCDAADAVGWFCGDSPRLDVRFGMVDREAWATGSEPIELTRDLMAAESELARMRHLMAQMAITRGTLSAAANEAVSKADDITGAAELFQSTIAANERVRVQTVRRMRALGLPMRTGYDDVEGNR